MSDYTDALRRELGYYEAQGRDDRAKGVRKELDRAEKAEIAELRKAAAEKADELQDELEAATAEAKGAGRSLRSGRREQATPADGETATPDDAAGITEPAAVEPAGDAGE